MDSGTTRSWYEERNRYVLGKLAALPWGETLTLVDPTTTLCTAQRCRSTLDGKAMYFDADHLSIYGANQVLRQVESYLDFPQN